MARKQKNTFDIPTLQDAVVAPVATEQASDNVNYSRSRCGGALRQAREAQGLSVQDVASKLRLGPKQIEAIEADHFAILPEPTIVRGFIRNYAKQLKINADPLLDAYAVIVPRNTHHELILKPATNMQVTGGDKPKTASYIWAGLALLCAVGAWLFYQNYIEKPSPTKPSVNMESSLEPLPEPALPAAERVPALQASTEITLPVAADVALPGATVDLTVPASPNDAPVTALPMVAASALPVEMTPEASLAPIGLAKLEFSANQETWVGIVDAEGKLIYDKIIFAGSRETIQAKLPLNITVGNAGATSLNMNGKTVALAPHTRNNVARIKLE